MAQPELHTVSPEAERTLRRLARECVAEAELAERYGVGHSTWIRLTAARAAVSQPSRWYAGTLAAILRIAFAQGRRQRLNELLSAMLGQRVRLTTPDDEPSRPDATSGDVLRALGDLSDAFGDAAGTIARALDDGIVTADEADTVCDTCERLVREASALQACARGAMERD